MKQKKAAVWYSTRGCESAKMSAEEKRDWAKQLNAAKEDHFELCVPLPEAEKLIVFFSSRRRHTRWTGDRVQTCALPIFVGGHRRNGAGGPQHERMGIAEGRVSRADRVAVGTAGERQRGDLPGCRAAADPRSRLCDRSRR